MPGLILYRKPISANDGNQDIAGTDSLLKNVDKVIARLQPIDIHKNVAFAETGHEAVIDPPRVGTAIVAPITDKNAWHVRRAPGTAAYQPQACSI